MLQNNVRVWPLPTCPATANIRSRIVHDVHFDSISLPSVDIEVKADIDDDCKVKPLSVWIAVIYMQAGGGPCYALKTITQSLYFTISVVRNQCKRSRRSRVMWALRTMPKIKPCYSLIIGCLQRLGLLIMNIVLILLPALCGPAADGPRIRGQAPVRKRHLEKQS